MPDRPASGRWFEELTPGLVIDHAVTRTINESDNTLFSVLSMNPQPLHLDAAWSATQPFGQPLVNSLFTLSTLVGQSVSQLTRGTLVANLGFGAVAFPHPVFVGDTLYGESVVESKRLSSSRPGEGIVVLAHTARNQDGVVVATASRTMLVWTREAGERAASAGGASGAGATSGADGADR